jgi:uncharacterized protein (TIGR02246 family)
MTLRPTRILIALVLTAVATVATAGPVEEVRAAERAWLDAYERADAEAMDRIVADDFAITYQDGNHHTKSDIIDMVRKAAAAKRQGSKIVTEGTVAHQFGDHTIVLRGVVISEWIGADGKPKPVRSQYTDTWVKLDGKWQVAASHLTSAPEK